MKIFPVIDRPRTGEKIGVTTLRQLAELAGGQAVGDPETQITGIRPFDEAQPGDITLAAERKFRERLDKTRATAVILPIGTKAAGKAAIQVENPRVAFAHILAHFHAKPFQASGVSSQAAVGEDCRISEEVSIDAFARIGNNVEIGERVTIHAGVSVGEGCRIGSDCILHPNVTIYPDTLLGQRVVIHSGTVIGADGFGYAFDGDEHVKIPQTGRVEIGDDVEIGANSAIDRATFGATVIGSGVKIDNLVHIAHNCRIGDKTIIVGCVGISGSVTIGKGCILAGQSGVVGHIILGDNVTVLSKTQVDKDVPAGSTVSGMPARDHRQELKNLALIRKLPEMSRDLRSLKKRIDGIEEGQQER